MSTLLVGLFGHFSLVYHFSLLSHSVPSLNPPRKENAHFMKTALSINVRERENEERKDR